MKEESKSWLAKAEDDLEKASVLFKAKKYDGASFYCQQAAEKALKAVMIEEKGLLLKIHDLVKLGKELNLPNGLLEPCKELTIAYTFSRYPDTGMVKDVRNSTARFMNTAKGVVEWAKARLS